MARVRAESQPVSSGNMLTVLVSLSVVFLLFMAFLGAVKSGAVYTEENLLYAALIFYGAATALYLGFGVTGIPRYVHVASFATALGFFFNTLAVGHRWYIAGHPPFSSIYEMLLSFVWTLAALTIFVERRYHVQVIGTVTMPLATLSGKSDPIQVYAL